MNTCQYWTGFLFDYILRWRQNLPYPVAASQAINRRTVPFYWKVQNSIYQNWSQDESSVYIGRSRVIYFWLARDTRSLSITFWILASVCDPLRDFLFILKIVRIFYWWFHPIFEIYDGLIISSDGQCLAMCYMVFKLSNSNHKWTYTMNIIDRFCVWSYTLLKIQRR